MMALRLHSLTIQAALPVKTGGAAFVVFGEEMLKDMKAKARERFHFTLTMLEEYGKLYFTKIHWYLRGNPWIGSFMLLACLQYF